jgi:hypothetical protein
VNILIKIFLFFLISTQAFAGWNCSEAWSKCSADVTGCNVNYTCSACYQVNESMVATNFGTLSTSGGQRMPYNCKQEVLKCTLPQEKVGTKPNGDDECACPEGVPNAGSLYQDEIDAANLRGTSNTPSPPPPPPPGVYDDSPFPVACVAETNGGCKEGFKPKAGVDLTVSEIITSPANQMAILPTYCVPDVPPPTECGAGYKANPQYNADDPASMACIDDVTCPEGTTKIAAIETRPGLNFFGTMPNPRFPTKTGYCNDNYCCSGPNPNPLPTGESYCAQGSAIGFTDGESNFADDSTTGGCTCPKNATHSSEGQYQTATSWLGSSFLNKNASLSPIVCDYTKPPADGLPSDGEGLDTESIWKGKFDACAKFKDKGQTYDLCVSMDESMRDWVENNVDCGAKKGMECLSAKMNNVMKHCHVVDGVVTCDQKYSPPEGVELPEAVIAKSDSHGFPQKQIDDLFDTAGMYDSPTGTGTGSGNKPPPITPPKPPPKPDKPPRPPVPPALTTPKDRKFADVWESKLLTDQRNKYSSILDEFMKMSDKFKLPKVGGNLPCYEFDINKFFTPTANSKKVCLGEKPYIDFLDIVVIFITFLTYLLPIVIFIRS